MARSPTLSFDRGTLLLHPPPPGKAWIDYAAWDDRVERFRIPALYYRRLVEALTAEGTTLIDSAREFGPLTLVSALEMTPYPHQREALAAWVAAGRLGVVVLPALLALVEPGARGDPESPLQWTTKSTRNLAAELTRQGHRAGPDTVARLLREESFSLQGNAKTAEGGRHPGRDAQFRYISGQAMAFQAAGDPVISVDAKKKQNVGRYKNGGREWRPKGQPEPVNVYDFIDKELGKVTPYGVYDITANAGWVSVGTDHDTAEFAVATIATWWEKAGRAAYPGARRLLITADGGGSNGYRTRLWKTGLAKLADATGLEITVCHFPPGTSKWNKIEHRLFSHISMNWRGRPLTSHEVIVRTIAATTTRTGLTVTAELDTGSYPKGIKITDEQMKGLDKRALRRHEFHGEWNYTLIPADGDTRNLLIGPH